MNKEVEDEEDLILLQGHLLLHHLHLHHLLVLQEVTGKKNKRK
jgi:hypothetical protein